MAVAVAMEGHGSLRGVVMVNIYNRTNSTKVKTFAKRVARATVMFPRVGSPSRASPHTQGGTPVRRM